MVIFGIFLIAFLFVVIKGMFYDEQKLMDKRAEGTWREIEEENKKHGQ